MKAETERTKANKSLGTSTQPPEQNKKNGKADFGSFFTGKGSGLDAILQKLQNPQVDKILADIRQQQKRGTIPANVRLGDILAITGLVTPGYVDSLVRAQQGSKKKIGELLIERGSLTKDQILAGLAIKFGFFYVDLDEFESDTEAISLVPASLVKKLTIFPIAATNDCLLIAISNPSDHANIEDILRFCVKRRICIVVCNDKQINKQIFKYYDANQPNVPSISPDDVHETNSKVSNIIDQMGDDVELHQDVTPEEVAFNESDSLVVKLVNGILVNAYQMEASDIHFEPMAFGTTTMVRYRIDGVCSQVHAIKPIYERAVLSRLKIMARLDIAEKRKPQSGKISLNYKGKKIEFRLEITPTIGGHEDAVLRILTNAVPLPITKMDFSPTNLDKLQEIICKPYGIILCVGPTGAGKTTTLHSALGHINAPDKKIWTAEDPVEITQKGLRQVNIHAEIGLTFQNVLRSFLRADPDVIMVGEMRDLETAKTAIDASLTGHLVFSTLHTNSAPETIARLVEMGIEPFNFADALLGVLAQRLCRRLCVHCKTAYHPDEREFDALVATYGEEWFAKHEMPTYSSSTELQKKVGCEKCGETGYKSRIAIHELLVNSKTIRIGIKESAPTDQLAETAIEEGMRTLRMDGVAKVLQGNVDLLEVNRVTV